MRPTLLFMVLAIAARGALAQDAPPDTLRTSPRPLAAVAFSQAVNVLVNRVDAMVFNYDWAKVTPSSWSRNTRLGWEWDENNFTVNLLSHPYHGSLYFNAARANGLDYWESVPLAFLGSWTWERFGETHRPSLNDFFMTSLGGIGLGEVSHRLGALIRGSGSRSIWRELAALPIDPLGGLHRLGGAGARAAPLGRPEALRFRAAAGSSAASDTTAPDDYRSGATLVLELDYGDPFERHSSAPFGSFTLFTEINSYGGLSVIRAAGRLFTWEPTSEHVISRHQLAVSQSYEFVETPAYNYGAQSIGTGIASRFILPKEFQLRTGATANVIVMGAVDAPAAGVGEREYDFGPGLGLVLEGRLQRRGTTIATAWYRSSWIHSVSGANADHFTHFVGVDGILPLGRRMGIGVHTGYYVRASNYDGEPSESARFPEGRIYLAWNTGR